MPSTEKIMRFFDSAVPVYEIGQNNGVEEPKSYPFKVLL